MGTSSMPYKRKYRKRRRKPNRRRRRKKKSSTISTTRVKGINFSDQTFIKMPYHQELVFNAASFGVQNYRTNAIFAINATVNSGQPMMFDEYIKFYDHWTVHGSKWTVKVINLDPSDLVKAKMIWTNSSVPPTTDEQWVENVYSREMFVGSSMSGKSIRTMSRYCPTRKLAGVNIGHLGKFEGSTIANCSNTQHLHLDFFNFSDVTDLNIKVSIKVVFYVTWRQRRIQTTS